MIRSRDILLGLVALGACGSGVVRSEGGRPASLQFTREVRAVPADLVQAAVSVFGRYGIPIAEADEPGGRLRTRPVNLRAMARQFDEAPLSCPQGTPRDKPVLVEFEANVRRTDRGSAMSLETERASDGGCVVRARFVVTLLDEIVKTTGDY